MTNQRFDLRTGIRDPVVLMISRRAVEKTDVESVIKPLRILLATREDTWFYKGQMSLVMDGWDEDPRALVDIPEVRTFLRASRGLVEVSYPGNVSLELGPPPVWLDPAGGVDRCRP